MTELEDLAQTPPLVTHYCDNLPRETSDAFQNQAKRCALRAELDHPINRAPSTVAAAAVYLTGLQRDTRFSQAEIASAADVSTVALRNCYTELAAAEEIGLSRGVGQPPTEEVDE